MQSMQNDRYDRTFIRIHHGGFFSDLGDLVTAKQVPLLLLAIEECHDLPHYISNVIIPDGKFCCY